LLRDIFRDHGGRGELSHTRVLRTLCIHKAENILKEAKGRVPKRKRASADEQEFALLLLLAGLVEVR